MTTSTKKCRCCELTHPGKACGGHHAHLVGDDCPYTEKPAQENVNYHDARTPEERRKDAEIKVIHTSTSDQSMEERFDAIAVDIIHLYPNLMVDIKAFITAEILAAKRHGFEIGRTMERQRIVALVEGLRETEPHHASSLYSFKRGKNSMLDAVLRSIQEPTNV